MLPSKLADVFHRRLLGSLLRRLSTAAASGPEKPPFMAEYLISSCGFSSAEASKAVKRLSHLKSTQKPDTFLGFMRSHGFDDSQLRKIVSLCPRLLSSDVEKTLAPKLRSLESVGYSGSHLTSFVASHPNFLCHRVDSTLLERVKFWESLLGSKDSLIKVLGKHDFFFFLLRFKSSQERAVSNLSLLRQCGVSEQRIASWLRKNPRIILKEPEKFSAMVEQVERMGIPRSSGMFPFGFHALSTVSKARLDANLKLMKSFGWSEVDFFSVFCKAPNISALSRKLLIEKMNFLVKEVGLEPSEIASTPMLLLHSLEKRLVPRHHIINMLESRNLLDRKRKLTTVVSYSDKVFREKYVTTFKDKVPELQKIEMVSNHMEVAP